MVIVPASMPFWISPGETPFKVQPMAKAVPRTYLTVPWSFLAINLARITLAMLILNNETTLMTRLQFQRSLSKPFSRPNPNYTLLSSLLFFHLSFLFPPPPLHPRKSPFRRRWWCWWIIWPRGGIEAPGDSARQHEAHCGRRPLGRWKHSRRYCLILYTVGVFWSITFPLILSLFVSLCGY